MKKAIFYIIGFITIVFILPVIFTTSPKSQETIAQEENQTQNTEENNNIKTEDMNPYYLKYQKIKLLHTETGEIEELDMNEYLYGVVSAEMPASYEKEALKAQAIVARTYTIYQITKSNRKTW